MHPSRLLVFYAFVGLDNGSFCMRDVYWIHQAEVPSCHDDEGRR